MLAVVLLGFIVIAHERPAAAQELPPGGTYVDDDGNIHEGYIEAITGVGVTNGCDVVGPRYCPADSVTRAQMASFLVRALMLPEGEPGRFEDDDGSVHESAIEALAAAGITAGCDVTRPALFCPNAAVTRGQMAAFLFRALDLPDADGPDRFVDDNGHFFEAEIEAVARAGISTGCNPPTADRFCPEDPVRRDQMATFLGRALSLIPLTPPPATTPDDRLLADVEALVAFGPRVAGTDSELAAAAWLEAELLAIVGNVATEDVPLPNGRTSRNVVATVGAGTRKLLIGGHIDSVVGSPGADDNASGVAVILELARRLAGAPLPNVEVTIALFGAEEILEGFSSDNHHFGSRQMAARLEDEGELPDRVLVVDMVGFGDDLWAVTYLDQLPEVADMLVAAGDTAGVPVTRVSRGDISDHEAFVRVGVSAAFMWRPDNPNYHGPGDVDVRIPALIDDLAVIEAFLDAVAQLADDLGSPG